MWGCHILHISCELLYFFSCMKELAFGNVLKDNKVFISKRNNHNTWAINQNSVRVGGLRSQIHTKGWWGFKPKTHLWEGCENFLEWPFLISLIPMGSCHNSSPLHNSSLRDNFEGLLFFLIIFVTFAIMTSTTLDFYVTCMTTFPGTFVTSTVPRKHFDSFNPRH